MALRKLSKQQISRNNESIKLRDNLIKTYDDISIRNDNQITNKNEETIKLKDNSSEINKDVLKESSNKPSNTNEAVANNQSQDMNLNISFKGNDVRVIRTSKIASGKYCFIIDDLNICYGVKGTYGVYDQLIVDYRLIDYNLKEDVNAEKLNITLKYTVSNKPDSAFSRFITSFKPIFNGCNINIKQLKGYQGVCNITHNRSDYGDIYEQLEILQVFKEE